MSLLSSLTISACLASCLAAAAPSWASAQDAQTTTTTTTENAQPAQPATVQVQTAPAPAPAASSTTSTTYVNKNEHAYVDTEETVRRLPNRSMLSTGGTLFIISYVPSIVVAASADWEDDNNLYAPVIGPWMYLARGDNLSTGGRALLAVDGVFQDLGALMMVGSLFIPERRERHGILFGSNDRLHVAPSAQRYTAQANGANGYALSLAARGRF